MTINAPRWLGKSPRALGIVRVSSKKQGDNNSPGVQREGILAHAKAHGAQTVEAYPVDPASPSYRFMGFIPAFERERFREAGRLGTRRHVYRRRLRRRANGSAGHETGGASGSACPIVW